MNIFEAASKKKLRFSVLKGTISTEDLWDLSLESLDLLARGLNKQLKDLDEESFIAKKTTTNTDLSLRFEIVKHVIEVKLAEADRKKLNKEKAEKRAQLMALLGEAQLSELKKKSISELQAELNALDEV